MTSNTDEQAQYCISTNCTDCNLFKQNCKHLNLKVTVLNNTAKHGKISRKAKRKMWHMRGGVCRGIGKRKKRKMK